LISFKDFPAVILAAGECSRFNFNEIQKISMVNKFLENRNLKDSKENKDIKIFYNKFLLPINEYYTNFDYLIFNLVQLGIKKIIIITGFNFENIFNYIKNFKNLIQKYIELPIFNFLHNKYDEFQIYGIKADDIYIKGPLYSFLTLKKFIPKKIELLYKIRPKNYDNDEDEDDLDEEIDLEDFEDYELFNLENVCSNKDIKELQINELYSDFYLILPSDTFFQSSLLKNIANKFNYQISFLSESNIKKYCYIFGFDEIKSPNINFMSDENIKNYKSSIWYQNKHLNKIVKIGELPHKILKNYRFIQMIPIMIVSIPFILFIENLTEIQYNKIIDVLNIYNKMSKNVQSFHIKFNLNEIPFIDFDNLETYKDFSENFKIKI